MMSPASQHLPVSTLVCTRLCRSLVPEHRADGSAAVRVFSASGAAFLTSLMTLLLSVSGWAQDRVSDWPQWRGSRADGISADKGLVDEWPPTGPPVLWSREIGQGYSSFIAVGNRVYTQAQTLYEQAVICLDAETGQTVWSSRYAWPYDGGGLYPGPRSTPAFDRGRIYFAAPDGAIGCLDAETGTAVWTVNPTKQFRGRGTDFGYSCSPLVVEGMLIVPVGGEGASVVALDGRDGSVVWRAGDSPASYASPLVIERHGHKLVIALLENSLAAFALQTGKLLWEIDLSEGYDEHSAAPLYREPFLMIAGPFRSGAKCYRLDEDPEQPPSRAWELLKFSNDIASSVLHEDRVYGFDLRDQQSRINRPSRGEYRCLDFLTGKILWSSEQPGHANTIVADGKLVLFNDRGEVLLARAGTDDYQELARAQVFQDEICWSPPALSRGRLYLRTQSRAVCLLLGRTPSQTPLQTLAEIPRYQRAFDPTPLLGGEREFPATTPEWDEFGSWYAWSILIIGISAGVSGLLSRCGRRGRNGELAQVGREPATNAVLNRTGPMVPDVSEATVNANGSGAVSESPRPDSRGKPSTPSVGAGGVFWSVLIAGGAVGSPILNSRLEGYVFLWPLVLWAALQITVLTIVWADGQPDRRAARWRSRLVGLGFLAACALYFHLCRRLGLSIEWGFLVGLLPGFPITVLGAFAMQRPWPIRRVMTPLLLALSFSGYFWSAAAFMKWSMPVGS